MSTRPEGDVTHKNGSIALVLTDGDDLDRLLNVVKYPVVLVRINQYQPISDSIVTVTPNSPSAGETTLTLSKDRRTSLTSAKVMWFSKFEGTTGLPRINGSS